VAKGKIKKVVQDKGFGFIEGPNGKDVFFHQSSVANGGFDDLTQGQEVEFEMDQDGGGKGKGPRAKSVRPV
jgi:CspA family cold shock protein